MTEQKFPYMKAIRTIAWILLFIPALTNGQEIQQSVIASAGGHHEVASVSLSWTLGEVAVETLGGDNYILNLGFQQGDLTITSLLDESFAGFSVKTFPNPVQNKLTVEFEKDKLYFRILDINGRQLKNGFLYSGSGILDFEDVAKGTYFLEIDKKRTCKIIKQ